MMDELFITEVGSCMWGMETPDSDHDYMIVYQQPTKEILSGYPYHTGKAQQNKTANNKLYDCQFMEIGHLVNLLIKGNVNAIWTATSPIIIHDSILLQQLRELVFNNVSSRSFDSINGMALSQYHDAIKRPGMRENKAYKTCLRTLNFGITMLSTGRLSFKPVLETVDEDLILTTFTDLKVAYEMSKLPDKPNEDEFREFLYHVRVNNL